MQGCGDCKDNGKNALTPRGRHFVGYWTLRVFWWGEGLRLRCVGRLADA